MVMLFMMMNGSITVIKFCYWSFVLSCLFLQCLTLLVVHLLLREFTEFASVHSVTWSHSGEMGKLNKLVT